MTFLVIQQLAGNGRRRRRRRRRSLEAAQESSHLQLMPNAVLLRKRSHQVHTACTLSVDGILASTDHNHLLGRTVFALLLMLLAVLMLLLMLLRACMLEW